MATHAVDGPKETSNISGHVSWQNEVVFRIEARSRARSASSSPGLLETLSRSSSCAIVTLDRTGLVTGWNQGAHSVAGWSSEDMLGQSATRLFTAADNAQGVLALAMADAQRLGRCEVEHWHPRKDGSTFWGTSEFIPLADTSGRRPGYVVSLSDRSGDKAASMTQRIEVTLLGKILATSRVGVSLVGLDGSPTGPEATKSGPLSLGLPCRLDQWKEDGSAALAMARAGGTGHFQTTDQHENRHWEVAVTPILGTDGTPRNLLAVSREITDLRRAEQRQKLLMQELAHRVKNTFAMVHAIASQTLSGPTMPAGLRNDFSARLLALSHAHDMLMQGDWASARLRPLVEGIARLHGLKASDRFKISGADLTLGPRMALSFALVLHELGTNALKYGALSNGTGRVVVSWTVEAGQDGPLFRLRWTESGGPAVRTPDRKGFGSRLIARSFPTAGGVTSAMTFEPEGVAFAVEAPMAVLQQP
jgi:PAS domain S-box-containing protein